MRVSHIRYLPQKFRLFLTKYQIIVWKLNLISILPNTLSNEILPNSQDLVISTKSSQNPSGGAGYWLNVLRSPPGGSGIRLGDLEIHWVDQKIVKRLRGPHVDFFWAAPENPPGELEFHLVDRKTSKNGCWVPPGGFLEFKNGALFLIRKRVIYQKIWLFLVFGVY